MNSTTHPVRARSHLLHLLGEELIGDDRLAVFELVKNAYDADANNVRVKLCFSSHESHSIIVQDDGRGMTLNDLTNKWLELATDSRRRDRDRRSSRYGRLPLGEKGVGRIAALKLGSHIALTTRAQGSPELHLSLNWDDLLAQGPYLEDLQVSIETRDAPALFIDSTGTRIEIGGLRRSHWSRADVRKLYRLVTSLSSPFRTPDRFAVVFQAPGRESDIADLVSPNEFTQLAIWQFHFTLDGDRYDWSYSFNPPRWKGVQPRKLQNDNDGLLLHPLSEEDSGGRIRTSKEDSILVGEPHLRGIGPISGSIYAYYRRSEVLNASGSNSLIKTWLKDQTGVRVYRDGIRVFNYGERNDDWLGLNVRRINTPTGKLGTNSVVAGIDLDLDSSFGLKEKTNREGFDQNETFFRLQRVVLSVFEHLEILHANDRKALDEALRGGGNEPGMRTTFHDALTRLTEEVKRRKLEGVLQHDIATLEREYSHLKDVMTSAGVAGLNLAVVFHEVEREVGALAQAVDDGLDHARIRRQIEHLNQLLQGFAPLLRKNPVKTVTASTIIKSCIVTRDSRFKHHGVVLSAPVLAHEQSNFQIRGHTNLIIGALGNLLDNALFWARVRSEKDPGQRTPAVLVLTHREPGARSGLIAVVDNGSGFGIPPDQARQAFSSTRPGGMGLGLYFAGHVMEQSGGELTIHTAAELGDEVELPRAYDGAAVVLRFSEVD